MLFVVVPAFASNITIYDENGYRGTGTGFEDEETEPGMDTHQVWDLEGFFLENNVLSIMGGFEIYRGVPGYPQYGSGGIFIATEGKPTFGDADGIKGFLETNKSYGFNYVFDLNFAESTYIVWGIGNETILKTAYYSENEGSSPWRYVSGGVETGVSGSFSQVELNDSASGFSGGLHYFITGFDLSFLGHDTDFYAHFTMGCGNDNLMGKGTVVPEPATLILLGSGLAGMAFYRRKKK
jgi:hypothetical protein